MSSLNRLVAALGLAIALLFVILAVRPFVLDRQAEPAELVSEERQLMGTIWALTIVPGERPREEARAALEFAFRELNRIELVMSEWRPDTPVSAINAAAGRESIEAPTELVELIERAIDYGHMTQGAFDITWRGLSPLWNLNEAFRPPSDRDIAAAREMVDFRRISIDGRRVGLPEGFAIGLGGIAKGYAIDRAAAVLTEAGFPNHLINGGGDVFAAGRKGRRSWTVGIRAPRKDRSELLARLPVSNGAVVTSGDYERFVIVDGVRYHHILDPRTGRPAQGCQSVTILAPTAEQADVLATAAFVLGPVEGLELANRIPSIDIFVVDSDGEYWMTPGFRKAAELLP